MKKLIATLASTSLLAAAGIYVRRACSCQ